MLVDARGVTLPIPLPPRRVVSLVPSITESLFDLGAGDSVVGVTDYCIFPKEQVAAITKVGGTKNPKIDVIRELKPDLVYMNLEENLPKHAQAIEEFAPLFVTEPKSIPDVIRLLHDLASIHGVTPRAIEWCGRITEEVELIASRRFTFAAAIWKAPWMWCGGDTYVSSLVSAFGGRNVFAKSGRYPVASLEEVATKHPDVIFLPDEPYPFRPSEAAEAEELTHARVVGPFPGHLFTWHGTRTLLGLRFLRETLGE